MNSVGSELCQYVTDGEDRSLIHCLGDNEHSGEHTPSKGFKLVNPVWRVYEPKTEERDMLYGESD